MTDRHRHRNVRQIMSDYRFTHEKSEHDKFFIQSLTLQVYKRVYSIFIQIVMKVSMRLACLFVVLKIGNATVS